ncbi:deoxyribodipyrimidine photo-lyase [Tenacibaculum sp. SG-28]|uniref:cryptochrome/photolyase family protein n=1 Tax=Tenacibaculum sp. SG-28 TaxID=754426 RepID=UPI000CF4FE43|nr:deoxyribodipyrimidine photo-lyase [Tenacibaculum sp. SG-28]PQJ23277.1 deoxyribodipyrimidine photolyase [Tenacibaculum sp. SG-28]
MKNNIVIFWFRRDLRLEDNKGLFKALNSGYPVLPLFIFDAQITDSLPTDDARLSFIYDNLKAIHDTLLPVGSGLCIKKGNPLQVFKDIIKEYSVKGIYLNNDYEPYAIKRDVSIQEFVMELDIPFLSFKDQVIFEKTEVVKKDKNPYTVFTPYKNQWLKQFDASESTKPYASFQNLHNLFAHNSNFPSLNQLGFTKSKILVKPYNLNELSNYEEDRNYPSIDKTSYVSPYLRFGVISIRKHVSFALKTNLTYLSELIWREFFMQILYNFPAVVTQNFKRKYDAIPWRNDQDDFEKWCTGNTGYPFVDAGMRELNKTGYMHNRVRMITASFLCKHLLIDWRWGEAYFASKLLDYELASNNGNWQWAASTGCDAVPYFRIFNPTEQLKKFDKNLTYTNKWVDNFNELSYPTPIVDHKLARERAITTYKSIM